MRELGWHGILGANAKRQRLVTTLVCMVLSVFIVFTQQSFYLLGSHGGIEVHALMLLSPVALASLLLGTCAAGALGAFAGLVLLVHARTIPLDIEELTLVDPITSIGLYALFGFVSAVLFACVMNRMHESGERAFGIALVCLIACALGNVAVTALADYAPTVAGALTQIAVDTLVCAVPCIAAHAVSRWLAEQGDDIGLRETFRVSILLTVLVAFMVVGTVSFNSITLEEHGKAEEEMQSEVNYICLQLSAHAEQASVVERLADAVGFSRRDVAALGEDLSVLRDFAGDVLSGYTMAQTGTVMIVRDGKIVETDDARLTVGARVEELLGADIATSIEQGVGTGRMCRILYDGVLASDGDTGGFGHEAQIGYLCAARSVGYTVVAIKPSTMVYAGRTRTMAREMVISLALLIAVFAVVTHLIDTTVARRIDQTNEALGRICAGDLDVRVRVAGTREFKSLSWGINKTVDALARLIDEAEHRMEADLATGRAIQEGALPRSFPAFPDVPQVDLFASMDAAREVGGDFYDFFEVDSHTVAFLIADVSGKGIPGALFMMAAKAEIQSQLQGGLPIGEAMRCANEYLCAHNEAHMFVTVWAATLAFETGELTFVNAGHNYPLLRHGRGGDWEWVQDKSGMFLGLFEGRPYREHVLLLSPGDELVLYTDGVNEAFDVREREYGNDRLAAFLADRVDERPFELVRELREDVGRWAQGAEQSDDITIMAVEYALPANREA